MDQSINRKKIRQHALCDMLSVPAILLGFIWLAMGNLVLAFGSIAFAQLVMKTELRIIKQNGWTIRAYEPEETDTEVIS